MKDEKDIEYGSIPTEYEEFEIEDGSRRKHKEAHSGLGITFIALGSFAFSVQFLLVKLVADTNPFTLVFYRAVVEIGICVAKLWYYGEEAFGPKDVRFWLVIRGSFGAAAVCAFFFGIEILPLPDAVTIQFTTPPFAAAFAVCLAGEKWMMMDKIGAVVCLSGVALIAHPTWLFGSAGEDAPSEASDSPSALLQMIAVLVTFGGAAMAGLAYVSVRKIGDRASAVVMVFYYSLMSIPIASIGSAYFLGTWNVWGGTGLGFTDFVFMFFVGVAAYIGQWFTNMGLQLETAGTATLVTTTQIVWTYAFELMFLHESFSMWSMGGTALIIGYMMILAVIKMVETQGKAANNTIEEHPQMLPSET